MEQRIDLAKHAHDAQKSLYALNRFLKQQHVHMNCGDIDPLLRLYSAVVDLTNGRASPMFKPVERRPGNPGKGLCYETIQGLAARALEELVAAGDSPKEAAKRVAGALKKSGREDMKDSTPETVIKWREHLREGPGPGAPENALKHFNEPLWPGLSHRKKGEGLLIALKKNAKAADQEPKSHKRWPARRSQIRLKNLHHGRKPARICR